MDGGPGHEARKASSARHAAAHQQLAAEEAVICQRQAPQRVFSVGVHPSVVEDKVWLEL